MQRAGGHWGQPSLAIQATGLFLTVTVSLVITLNYTTAPSNDNPL